MNLLIVEDEIRLLNNVAYNIPWEEHGIEVVGIATNGKEALALFDLRNPDIMLLDIQLPDMNGLELLRALREKSASISFIVLSGHDDFQYARTALELGADNYLLKPAGNPEIVAAVSSLADRLRRQRESEYNQLQLQQKWASHLPWLQEWFLRNLVRGKYTPQEVERYSSDYFPGRKVGQQQTFIVSVLEMDPLPSSESRFQESDGPLLQFALKNLALEVFEHPDHFIFSDDWLKVVVLFGGAAEEAEDALVRRANSLVSKALGHVRDSLQLTASAGIGSKVELKDLETSYRQACRALSERVLFGYNVFIPYAPRAVVSGPIAPDREFERLLQASMESGDVERAHGTLERWFHAVCESASSTDAIQEQLLFIHSFFVRLIHAQGWNVADVAKEAYESFLRPPELISKEYSLRWMLDIVARFIEYGQEQRSQHSNDLVAAVMDLARSEMDQEMTLHDFADKLYVNSSYLSRLFKRETGMTFTAFYQDLKMQKARDLLMEGAKVYEAARQVGFKDIGYFTKLFRKHWGTTPGEVAGISEIRR